MILFKQCRAKQKSKQNPFVTLRRGKKDPTINTASKNKDLATRFIFGAVG